MYDLIVIGGGPAGTSAAIAASRNGARVLVLERGRFPRHKVCGEFVSAESLDLLTNLLGPDYVALLHDAIRIPGARLFMDGRMLEAAVEPAAASIARLDLDDALWASAVASGADVRQQTTVNGVTGEGPCRVATSAGIFEARSVVNASGRWSNLSSAPADNGQRREKWLGLKRHFEEGSPEPSVDLYFFDGGYCGVQPVELRGTDSKRGRVNACAMVRADVAGSLPEVFLRHPVLQRRSLSWQPLSDAVSTSPLVFKQPQPERDGMLQAGDAAGFVDPFVGDGISLALRSGSLTGECLGRFFEGEISYPEARWQYRQSYLQQLAPVFHASSKIRRMLVLPRAVRKPLLFLLENAPAVARYVISKTR